jgi:hypothetical protein
MTETEKLILEQLSELRADMKGVREKDIPSLRTDMAVMKEKTNTASKLYAGIGSVMSALVALWLTRHGN